MGLYLLNGLSRRLTHSTVLGMDSQAVIKALQNQCLHSGHYILDAIHHAAEHLHAKQDGLINQQTLAEGTLWKGKTKGIVDLQLHWVPGHCNLEPNEHADEEAKLATQGTSSDTRFLPQLLRKKLLLSISALRQENNKKLKKCWQHHWKNSERVNLLRSIDNSTPSKKYLRLIASLDRRQASIIFQLHSGHIALNQHLFCIRKAELPACPWCQGITVETVKHYLLDCPHYQNEQHMLQRKLRRNVISLSFLPSSRVAVMPLLKFIHATGRFKSHFGKDKVDKINTNLRRNGELQIAANKLESSIRKAISDKRKQALAQLRCQPPPRPPDLSHTMSSLLLSSFPSPSVPSTIPPTCSSPPKIFFFLPHPSTPTATPAFPQYPSPPLLLSGCTSSHYCGSRSNITRTCHASLQQFIPRVVEGSTYVTSWDSLAARAVTAE